MKQKKSRLNRLTPQGKEKRQQKIVESVEKERQLWKKSRRALVVLALLVLATVGFSAISSWRSTPLVSGALPTPTPLPSMPASAPGREYIYAGSALISTVEPFREPPEDLAVWRPSNGTWYVLNSATQQTTTQAWGTSTDIPAPGDFDGDGKTDFCVFRESTGEWYIIKSSDGSNYVAYFGTSGDKPAIGDYDGDGKSDVALWRPSDQTWYIKQSSNNSSVSIAFGSSGDFPTPGDFDGDGKNDPAIWRDSTHTFWVKKSTDGQPMSCSIGLSGDEPVIGDYDGDGKSDYAVRRGSDNYWRMFLSSDSSNTLQYTQWGLSSDIAVPGRYNDSLDNDAKTDIAVWRPSTGVWYIQRSSDASLRAQTFGSSGDKPLPANWRR